MFITPLCKGVILVKYVINGVECDTYAYLDDKQTGETVTFDLEGRRNFYITVYLCADRKPFPVAHDLDIECCFTKSRLDKSMTKTIVECSVGPQGEIIVPIVEELRAPGLLFCEISVQDTASNDDFIYKASDFRVAIV